MKQRNNRAWLFLLPAGAVLGLVGLVPLITVVNYSFFDIFTLDSRYWVGAEWYADLITSPELYAALGRSLLFTALVLAIQFPLGIACALMIPQQGFAKNAMLMILAMPLVVPWNMIPGMWLGFIDPGHGMLGRVIAVAGWEFDYKFNALHTWILILLMDTWHWVGLVAILAFSGLASIPPAYFQAAQIDGAGRWAVFRYVQLPRIRAVMLMALILRVMDSMMIYTEPFFINAGGPDNATSFLALELGEQIAAFDYGPAAARSVVYFLIVLGVAWGMKLASARRDAVAS